PCALRVRGRQPARREKEGSTPCPAGAGGLIATPRPRAVPPRRVRWTRPRRGASRGRAQAPSRGRVEKEGRSPCPAVSVLRAPEVSPRRRRGAEEAERPAAGVVGEVPTLPAARFASFGGRSPCPAVRRILTEAKTASMRRHWVVAARRRATVSAE